MTEQKTPDVYRAICQVAKEMSKDGIAKNRTNTQGQGYKFRGIDDFYNSLSAVLSGAGLCVLPRMSERVVEERTSKAGGALFYVTVRADFVFVSTKDGSQHTVTMYGEAMDSSDKATNKAMSAAYKYACMQVFCIPTEGMDDADAHTPEPAPKTTAAAPKHTQAQQQVIERKLAEASEKPWHAQFRAMVDKIGASEYSRILGNSGFTSAKEILVHQAALRVLAQMEQEYEDQQRSRGVA